MEVITFSILCIFFLVGINRLKYSLFYLLPVIYLAVSIYTYIGTEYFDFAKNVPFHFYDNLSGTSYQNIYLYYLLASFAFMLGLITCKNADLLILFRNDKPNVISSKVKVKYVVTLYVITVIFMHIGHGVGHLYFREGYTLGDSGIASFRVLYTMLLPLTCLLVPFVKFRFNRYLLMLILFILVQGTSSRNLVLLPVCYYIGIFLRDQKISMYKGGISLVLIILSVNIAIQYRDNQFQGVFPNLIYFFQYGLDYRITELAINYLTSFSVYASSITLNEHQFNLNSLLASINPLPSKFIDIAAMVESQKLNQYAPFPAIGFLSLGGPSFVFFYYFISATIWSTSGLFIASRSKVLAITVLVLFIMFCFLSLQYNLRSVTRLLYYIIIISVFLKLIKILRFNLSLHKKRSVFINQ